MCRCEECYSKYSTQKKVHDTRVGIKITNIGRVSEHFMTLTWDDGHTGLVARTDRGAYGPAPIPSIMDKYYDLVMRRPHARELWRGDEKEEVGEYFNYADVIASDEKVREFLAHFMKYGIVLMNGIPDDKPTLDIINLEMEAGPMRSTIYDEPDIVSYRHDPNNIAYSEEALQAHTDLTYYMQNPPIFVFRCHGNTCQGGESFYADTMAAMAIVREERPDYFEILAKVPVFSRYGPPGTNRYMVSYGTVVEKCGEELVGVRDQMWSLDDYEMEKRLTVEERKAWWEAYSFYRTKIDPPSNRLVRKLVKGEMAIIDNKRVLHGRNSFTATPGDVRIFDTSYADWSHFGRRLLDPSVHSDPPAFLELEEHRGY